MNFILVAVGGALGSVARYALSNFVSFYFKSAFPFGTVSINIVGSFLIGFCYYFIKNDNFFNENLKLFLIIGLFGGFTTFSTFSLDVLRLLEQNQLLMATVYVFFSIILSLIAVFGGYFIGGFFK
ncbi:MAG: CrcB protein [Rickettsiales bacterium]|jgi:CrcB protein